MKTLTQKMGPILLRGLTLLCCIYIGYWFGLRDSLDQTIEAYEEEQDVYTNLFPVRPYIEMCILTNGTWTWSLQKTGMVVGMCLFIDEDEEEPEDEEEKLYELKTNRQLFNKVSKL
jgi:hypothetical protein